MTLPGLDLVARLSATGLIASLVEGSVIAFLAWVFLKLQGGRDSKARFAIWFSSLFLIAATTCLGAFFSNGAHSTAAKPATALTLPSSWARDIFYLWAVGASLAFLRVAIGFWQLLRLRRSCKPLGVEVLSADVLEVLRKQTRGRSAKICVSSEIRVPTAIGFFKPLILIPAWAIGELSSAELDAVLIHEFEHLRRRDDWTNLAQKLLGSLLFFHPAVWWIEDKLALEREMACDDAVLARTENPQAYAACLVTVAEKGLLGRGLALAQAAVGRLRQTTLRVTQILSGDRNNVSKVGKPAAYLLVATSLAGLLMVSQAPPLVVFQAQAVASAKSEAAPFISAASLIPTSFKVQSSMKAEPMVRSLNFVHGPARQIPVQQRQVASHGDVVLSAMRPDDRAMGRLVHQVNAPAMMPMPVNAVFVVMHTEQYGDFSRTFWTICVWQVNAPRMIPLDPSKTTPAKSI
jgi:beta-lactamase regulating signal transducer with metallopeptidase domain